LKKIQQEGILINGFALKLSLVDASVQDKTSDGFGSVWRVWLISEAGSFYKVS
jgi:hypothetical protein